jgi:hypothetical protein
MKKSYFTAALMLTCLLGVGISAKAQDADAVVVSVPFEFVAGGVTLPAGEYRINRANPGVTRELAIRSYDKGGVFLYPAAFDESANDMPTLSFERAGGKYFLTRIKTQGGVYTIAPSREMIMLGRMNTPTGLTSSGTH